MSVKRFINNQEYRQSESDTEVYSDFLTSFLAHPNTGQITKVKEADAVKQALKTLILSNKYEKIRNPRWGCNIRRHLFEQFRPHVMQDIKADIENAIELHEPRVKLLDVDVKPSEDENSVFISIKFALATVKDTQELSINLYRVR